MHRCSNLQAESPPVTCSRIKRPQSSFFRQDRRSACLGSILRISRPSLSSSHPMPRVWSLAPPTTSPAVTAQTTLHKPKYPVHAASPSNGAGGEPKQSQQPGEDIRAASPVSNSSCGPLALVEHVGERHTPFRRPMPGRPNPVSDADGLTAGKQSNLSLFLLTTVPAGQSSRAVSAATVPATPSS
jgi:hypothetical protein